MLAFMISGVVLGHSLLKVAFLQGKVINHLDVELMDVLLSVLCLDQHDAIEQSPMFIVHLRYFHNKTLVPSVRIGDWVDDSGIDNGAGDGQSQSWQEVMT